MACMAESATTLDAEQEWLHANAVMHEFATEIHGMPVTDGLPRMATVSFEDLEAGKTAEILLEKLLPGRSVGAPERAKLAVQVGVLGAALTSMVLGALLARGSLRLPAGSSHQALLGGAALLISCDGAGAPALSKVMSRPRTV